MKVTLYLYLEAFRFTINERCFMDFEDTINIEGVAYVLSFKEVITPGNLKYFVRAMSVMNETTFEIRKEQGAWSLLPPVERWVKH